MIQISLQKTESNAPELLFQQTAQLYSQISERERLLCSVAAFTIC